MGRVKNQRFKEEQNMDLRWLEDVLILLEEGNLTRAAQRRAITQPAFSRRIRAFESWLGHDILDRDVNRVKIRDSARNSETEIRALIQRLNGLQKKMLLADTEQKNLTVTAQHSLALSVFPDFITLVNKEIESLTYRLKTADHPDCMSTLIRGDADIMLCYETLKGPKLPLDHTFLSMTWGVDCLVPVISSALMSSLHSHGSATAPIPVITFPKGSFFDRVLSSVSYSDVEHNPMLNIICESSFTAGAREMVLNGIGLAWVPMSLVSRKIESGELIDLSRTYGSVPLEVSLYARPEGNLNKTIVNELQRLRGRLD
tara:strand:+ start:339 stop:1283 length:945 start_codon:yes stop_codon:yes gene_type:complete